MVLIRRAARETRGQTLTVEKRWKIKKNVLVLHKTKRQYYIKCPEKLPIYIGCGDLNPRLSLLLYPFGLFDENSSSMTLQTKLNIPDKCPPLLPTDTYSLSWDIHSQETKTTERMVLACSKRPYRIPFDRGMFYIFDFLSHNAIKQCESPAFEIHIRTSYLCEDASAQMRFHDQEPENAQINTGMSINIIMLHLISFPTMKNAFPPNYVTASI